MFKSKKEKNKSSTTGGTSSYNETTSVQHLGGRTIMSRQISMSSSHTQARQERSYSVTHSSSAGMLPILQSDATPFTFNAGGSNFPAISTSRIPSRLTNSTSLPSHIRQPVLPRIESQLAAQQPNIARSLPASTNSIVPTYTHTCSKLGKALIINNVKFMAEKEERQGAENDSRNLKRVLKEMGFEIEDKMNMKGQDISKKIKSFSKSDFSRHDVSLIVIMSHGNNLVLDGNRVTKVRGGFTQIAGIDNVPVTTDDIIEMFTVGNCHRSLHGKPKIFIFQCCRGNKDQEVCHDAGPINAKSKQHTDILIAYSTLPGFLSNRNPTTGTWYIQSICEVFKNHYKNHHVEDMLKIVDSELGKKHPQYTQTSTYENRGFKQCFLFKRSS